MLERIKTAFYSASAATAAGSFMIGAAIAWMRARRATTREELLAAVRKMARQGDKAERVKSSDRRLQELNLNRAKESVRRHRELFERLEAHAKRDGAQALGHASRVRTRLGELEADLNKWGSAIERTGALCDAAGWATRFLAAYAADAALNPGSYGAATRALASRVVEDFKKHRGSAVRAGAKGRPGGIDPLLMELLGDAAPAAAKVGAWGQMEAGGLDEAAVREWAQTARSFVDDRTRIIRSKAQEPEVASRDAERTEMEFRAECAQIFWMGGLLGDAKDELERGRSLSGDEAALRQLGRAAAGAPLAGQALDGFNAWAAGVLELDSPKGSLEL